MKLDKTIELERVKAKQKRYDMKSLKYKAILTRKYTCIAIQ